MGKEGLLIIVLTFGETGNEGDEEGERCTKHGDSGTRGDAEGERILLGDRDPRTMKLGIGTLITTWASSGVV